MKINRNVRNLHEICVSNSARKPQLLQCLLRVSESPW